MHIDKNFEKAEKVGSQPEQPQHDNWTLRRKEPKGCSEPKAAREAVEIEVSGFSVRGAATKVTVLFSCS